MFEQVKIGENVTLILGDCERIVGGLPRDLSAIFDPPYGISHFKGASGAKVAGRRSVRRNSKPVAGDDRPFDPGPFERFAFRLMWGANHYARRLPEKGCWLAWDKTAGGFGPKDSYSDVELAWCSVNGNAKIFHYLWKGVCQDGEKGQRKYHPTQKPIALMEWCIGYSPTGSTVLDPYMGTGSTGIAAIKMGRPFIGIESDPEHFEVACDRMREVERQGLLFAA